MKRSVAEKKFHRRLLKAQQRGVWCVLCGQSAAQGLAVSWLDPSHLERGTVFFALCGFCMRTEYRERLTQLHRLAWQKRQVRSTQGGADAQNIAL